MHVAASRRLEERTTCICILHVHTAYVYSPEMSSKMLLETSRSGEIALGRDILKTSRSGEIVLGRDAL